MKNFFKVLAVLVIAAHVFALLFYVGILPVGFFRNLKLPEAGRLAEYILSMQDALEEEGKQPLEEEIKEGEAADPAAEAEAEKEEETSAEDREKISIELSGTLPELEEKDLYNLAEVLIQAGALRAADGNGLDHSDQIICEIAADTAAPGHFTAAFSLQTEEGQIERGPSAEIRVEMTEPFLAFYQDEVSLTAGTEFDPYENILICMDVDGTVLTEYVALDGYLNTDLAGDYDLRFYIYSRVNGSSASRNMMVHVANG